MLHDILQRIAESIRYDSDDGGGGGGAPAKSLEQLTVEKLSGSGEEPTPEPKKKEEPAPEPEPDGGDEPTPEPDPEPDEGADEPTPEPDTGDKSDKKDKGSGDDFFYDPEKHVTGEPAHANKFRSREQAEYAAINKADMLKKKIDEMTEDGVNPGAIPLPDALQGNIDSIENFTSLEIVNSMSDDELRTFLNESDATRQRFDKKHDRVRSQKELRQAKTDYEEKQVKLYDELEKLMSNQEIQANIDKIGNRDSGKEFIEQKINDKVREELSDDREALEDWIDRVDSGEINLSVREFDKQKQDKVDAIETKARNLRQEYSGAVDTFDNLYDLHEKVSSGADISPEQQAKKMYDSFDEFQNDRSGTMSILDDNPAAKSELIAAKKFAVQNKEAYNNLQSPRDWVQAMKGWDDHKQKVRANRQRKQLNGDGKSPSNSGSDDSDVPKPGDQSKLRGDDKKGGVHSQNKRSLDKLVQLTNAR